MIIEVMEIWSCWWNEGYCLFELSNILWYCMGSYVSLVYI